MIQRSQGSSPSFLNISFLCIPGNGWEVEEGDVRVGLGLDEHPPLQIFQATGDVYMIGSWPIKCIDLLLLVTLRYKCFLLPLQNWGFRLYRMTWFVLQEPLGFWQTSPFKKNPAFSRHPTEHKSNLWIYDTKSMPLKGTMHKKGGERSKALHLLFWGHCL